MTHQNDTFAAISLLELCGIRAHQPTRASCIAQHTGRQRRAFGKMLAQKEFCQYCSLLHSIFLIFILFMTVYQFITHNITHQTTLHTQALTARWCVGGNFTEESSLCGSCAWSTLHRRNKVSRNLIVCVSKRRSLSIWFDSLFHLLSYENKKKNEKRKILQFSVRCYPWSPLRHSQSFSLFFFRSLFHVYSSVSLFSQYNNFVHDFEYFKRAI